MSVAEQLTQERVKAVVRQGIEATAQAY